MGSKNYNTESSVSDISLWSSVLILIINSMQQWWGIFHKEMFRQKQIYHSSIIHPLMQYRPFDRTAFSTFRLSSDCFDPPHKKRKRITWTRLFGGLFEAVLISISLLQELKRIFVLYRPWMNLLYWPVLDGKRVDLRKQAYSKSPVVQYRWLERRRRTIILHKPYHKYKIQIIKFKYKIQNLRYKYKY